VDGFFTKEEIQPGIDSYARLIDDLAKRLYKSGRIKSMSTLYCLF